MYRVSLIDAHQQRYGQETRYSGEEAGESRECAVHQIWNQSHRSERGVAIMSCTIRVYIQYGKDTWNEDFSFPENFSSCMQFNAWNIMDTSLIFLLSQWCPDCRGSTVVKCAERLLWNVPSAHVGYHSTQGLPSGVEQAGAPPTGVTPTGGGGRFSLRAISNRLRGVDGSYEGRLAVASRELLEAEETVRITQKELQLVLYYGLSGCIKYIRQPNLWHLNQF